jgi:hypothetical protein
MMNVIPYLIGGDDVIAVDATHTIWVALLVRSVERQTALGKVQYGVKQLPYGGIGSACYLTLLLYGL